MDMRGLAHFIRDIRKATTNKKEEERRVDEELAKIRAKFVDTGHMSTYDRKKYVCKLMFISMLGYPIKFGHIEGISLMAENTPAEKLIGYLASTVLLNESSELLTLTTHTVYRDLMSSDDLNRGLALAVIANTGSRDFAEVMHDGVEKIVMDDTIDVHVRKKAVLTLLRVYHKYPEVVNLSVVVPKVTSLLETGQDGVTMCAVTFLHGCFATAPRQLFKGLTEKLIDAIAHIIIDKKTEPGYIYYGVPAPWLQTSILRLLRCFSLPPEGRLRDRVIQVLRKILKATDKVIKDAQTQQKQRGTQNRVSAMNAVLIEVVSLGIHWDLGADFILECANIMGPFIADKREANLRYIGLVMLSRLRSVGPSSNIDFQTHCKQYQQQIIVGLHDNDVSIRREALSVFVAMCGPANATETIKELLSYLPITDDPSFKRSLVFAITYLSEKYCDDHSLYMENLLGVIAMAGDLSPRKVAYRVVQVIVGDPAVQKRAASMAFHSLHTRKYVSETMVRVAAFILGEFGYQIALNAESTPQAQYACLSRHAQFCSPETQGIILNALLKFYNLYDNAAVRDKIAKMIASHKVSNNAELQQRAIEYTALIENGNAELLEKVLEPMPPFTNEVRVTLHDTSSKHIKTQEPIGSSKRNTRSSTTVQLHDLASFSSGEPQYAAGEQGDDAEAACLDTLFQVVNENSVALMRKRYAHSRYLFTQLLKRKDGTLFEDDTVELRCGQSIHFADCRVTVTVRDKRGAGLQSIALEVLDVEGGLLLQSRSLGGNYVAPGGTVVIEFAGRSLAPFKDPPSVSLRYTGSDGASHLETLSLPIISVRFVSPYNVDSPNDYAQLFDSMRRSIKPLTRTISVNAAESVNTLKARMESLGYSCSTTTAGGVVAIGAHATQPQEKVEYTAIACELAVCGGASVQVSVYCKDPKLQLAAIDMILLCI